MLGCLKIAKGYPEAINWRTDNAMARNKTQIIINVWDIDQKTKDRATEG